MKTLIKLLAVSCLFLACLNGQAQISGAGQLGCSGANTTGTAATSGTANNTVLATVTASPAYGVLVQLNQTSTISGGAITFLVSNDGTNFVNATLVLNPTTGAALTNPYTLVASTNQAFLIVLAGASGLQVKLTTAITGSATVTPILTPVCTAPVQPLSVDASGFLKVNLAASSGSNTSVNEAQINGVAPLMNNGVSGTGSQRINVASDNSPVSGFGAGAIGAAPPANGILEGGLGSGATGGFLIGKAVGDTAKAINISTATTTLIVTGVSGRQVRITAQNMITAAANNVAWIEGTGATCGTGTAGMAGGTTAASGYNFAANGGLAQGTGVGAVLQTTTAGDSVCLVTSAATQLSGNIMYAIY